MNRCEEVLMHHGTKGMKWGIRRYQNPDGSLTAAGKMRYYPVLKNLKNSKSSNLDKWGKTKDTNILYITGLSGSGKSSLASFIGNDNKTDVIHLDMYFNQMSKESRKAFQNKEFNNFLNKKVPNWNKIPDMIEHNIKDKKTWKTVDEFVKAHEEFGRKQYPNRKVIVEGVELLGETFYTDISNFKNKPVISIQTNPLISSIRGGLRDQIDPITMLQRAYGKQTRTWNKQIKDFERTTDAQKYTKWIEDYINNIELEVI